MIMLKIVARTAWRAGSVMVEGVALGGRRGCTDKLAIKRRKALTESSRVELVKALALLFFILFT